MPSAFSIHSLFDLTALTLAVLSGIGVYHWRFREALAETASRVGHGYFLALALGSLSGSFILGSANLFISGEPMIGRSILGAVFGAIITVEIYKSYKGARGSTGYIYAIPFCVLVSIGRLGCFFAGMDDHTYGVPTSLPWAVDFGDGSMRHPVQLYESLSMLLCALALLLILRSRPAIVIGYGFYLCIGFYASQRFLWEFLKPYGTVIGSLNLFHIICLLLVIYSLFMSLKVKYGYTT
jgi:phosphatidylglycerol---prolipoprotein diacylglyceryl transferase